MNLHKLYNFDHRASSVEMGLRRLPYLINSHIQYGSMCTRECVEVVEGNLWPAIASKKNKMKPDP